MTQLSPLLPNRLKIAQQSPLKGQPEIAYGGGTVAAMMARSPGLGQGQRSQKTIVVAAASREDHAVYQGKSSSVAPSTVKKGISADGFPKPVLPATIMLNVGHLDRPR